MPLMTASRADEAQLLDAMLALVRGIDRVHSSGTLSDRSGVTLERGLHPVVMTIAKLEPVRTTDLAAALALNNSTVSRHIARLEQLGWCSGPTIPRMPGRRFWPYRTPATTRTPC